MKLFHYILFDIFNSEVSNSDLNSQVHFTIWKFQTIAKYWKLNYCGAVIKHLLI